MNKQYTFVSSLLLLMFTAMINVGHADQTIKAKPMQPAKGTAVQKHKMQRSTPIGTKIGKRKLPDLVVTLSKPMTGRIVVKNIGTAPSGKTKLTLDCAKLPGDGRCPDSPDISTSYNDPAFPDHVVIKIPPLAPGARHIHTLSFWSSLRLLWQPGRYKFIATADAAKTVAERNESNNVATTFMNVSQRPEVTF